MNLLKHHPNVNSVISNILKYHEINACRIYHALLKKTMTSLWAYWEDLYYIVACFRNYWRKHDLALIEHGHFNVYHKDVRLIYNGDGCKPDL